MRRALSHLLITAALVAAAFIGGRISGRNGQNSHLEAKRDTLTVRETISLEKPLFLRERVRDTIRVAVRDTIRVRDTLWLELARTERIYEDSTYRACVSGYRPALDWIHIYRSTVTVTERVTVPRRGWAVGIGAGPAAGLFWTPAGLQPGIGAAITIGATCNF